MKKTVLIALATAGIALGAFGQGAVLIDNTVASGGGPALDTAGNFFAGPFGLEVWLKNVTSVPSGINNAANNLTAYANLVANGFTLQHTYTGKNSSPNPGAGYVALGELDMATATKGGNVVLALAMWTGAGNAFAGAPKAGVFAFVQPTADYTALPAPTIPTLTGWSSDLVMTTVTVVPEPSTFALAGLGAAALMIFRRRK